MGEGLFHEAVFKRIGYEPNKSQWPIHLCRFRIILVAGGWRAGKSYVGANEAIVRAMRAKHIWLIGKNYDSCREEFRYIQQGMLKLGNIKECSFPAQGQCSMTLKTGCLIDTHSAEDVTKIGMSAPDFVLICEAAQLTHDAFLRVWGRVIETRGTIMMTGTFEQALDWYTKYYKQGQGLDSDIRSFSLPSWSNIAVFPGGRYDPEILKAEQRLGTLFPQYCAAEPCQPIGIVLPEFANRIHVGPYGYDANIPVEIAVDPGYRGAHAVLAIQIKESIPYVVDEIYLRGYHTEDIILLVKQKPWGPRVQSGVIDIAGTAHQAMAAPIEVWLSEPDPNDYMKGGMGLSLEYHYVHEEEGINAFRVALSVNPVTQKPRVFFNHTCHGIISEMGGCESPLTGGGVWLRDIETNKLIDRNNHATKAFIYWYTKRYGYTGDFNRNDFGKLQRPEDNLNPNDAIIKRWSSREWQRK